MPDSHPWSFSAMKLYSTCPFRYHEEKVKKLYPFTETKHTRYGLEVHQAAEDYLGEAEVDLHPGYEQFRKGLDALGNIPGTRLCELKMALTEKKNPCGFKSKKMWCRGIADLVILQEDKGIAYVVDYKTGKAKYPDKDQLELMAVMIFETYPEVKKVKALLWFMVYDVTVKAEYTRNDIEMYWRHWEAKYARLKASFDNDKWPKKPNGLCRNYCPVEHCQFCGG